MLHTASVLNGFFGQPTSAKEKWNAYRILVGKPGGKRPHRRHRHRWEDNIKMDLNGVVWTGLNWLKIGSSGGLF
jgi:hypothetical protein